MTDKDFKALQASIDQKARELHCLQELYAKETGSYYTVKLGLKPDEKAAAVAVNYKADIDRKNKLLEEALSWLTALEWGVTLGVIVKIEKELGRTEDS